MLTTAEVLAIAFLYVYDWMYMCVIAYEYYCFIIFGSIRNWRVVHSETDINKTPIKSWMLSTEEILVIAYLNLYNG